MEKKLSTGNLFKRALSLALALVMLLGMVPVTRVQAAEGTTLYLKPNSNWLTDGARFAMYCWDDSSSSWEDMYDLEDGYYEGTVPEGYSNVIFCRMNPGTSENNWDNKWNQTTDLTVPADGTNCYAVEGWDKGSGTWSVYTVEEEDATTAPTTTAPDETEDGVYYVAGDSGLCGANWGVDDAANQMTKTSDGTYQKVYANVAAGTYSLKVTDGTWDNCWGDNGSNYTFVVSEACDVTVTFDPAAYTVSVTGDSVAKDTGLEITSMAAVDNGSGSWLNGVSWDPASDVNKMTEVSGSVYEITFENVAAGSYQFKFAANGDWTHSWGGGGAEGEAVYNGQNIPLTISYDLANVTLRLDMSGYNHAAKSGATYSVTVTEVEAEPTVDYYLIGFINGANYGCEEDYTNLGEYKFMDGKLTATFTQDSYVFVKTGDNAKWYMSEGDAASSPATLYNTTLGLTDANKLFVPGNTELTFTLVENADGSLTLSYAEAVPAVDYYLIGYINGANYGCEEDWENLGEYKFVDGKLTVNFTSDSYVFVKTGDNASWYLFENSTTDTTGTLYTGKSEKMFVPGNKELEFTLVENADGSLTLSYAEAADTNDVTLHFYKPESWGSTINAYLWTSGGAVTGYEAYNTWPGKAVSANAEHAGWYDLAVSTASPVAFNFIFNDGGNQTADLYTGDVTGDTELWIVDGTVYTEAPGEWSGVYTYNLTVYAQVPEGWAETLNAYVWDQNDQKLMGNWPGTAMEADAINEGWYIASVSVVDDNSSLNVIINDGNGNQTADLSTGTLSVKTYLWIVDGQVLTEAPEGWMDPNRTIHVPGTFPGPSWDASSNQMSYNKELGLYVYTFEAVPAANYEYKIAVGGSWNENYGAGGVKDGSNIAVSVPETMDVTIYYNDETHNSVDSISYIFADVTLTGTGIPEGTKLTDKGLTGIYSVTVPMTAGTYTDLVITCNGTEYAFGEVEIEEDKDVTFYMDPVTEIFYCDASDIPVNAKAIYFDSQNETYKQPFGAAAVGEEVTFAIDTGDDITSAVLVVKGLGSFPMTEEATETGKRWSAAASFKNIGEYDYYFSLSNGSTVAIYSDDDGYYGEGHVTDLTSVKPYDLVVYEADFETPDWMKDAVIYQIFPDRFFDGDVSNNQAQTWARGDVDYEYITDWYTLPENPEQEALLSESAYKATGAHYGDGEWSNEIYGGDLEGITQRIDYLKALVVNVIYLNPIFWSISNHRYDAVDYTEIDPILGTMGDFKELVRVAEANDMHIILDGVFNHVSDDSVYFDRYYKFLTADDFDGKIGAYPYWAYVYDYMADNGVSKSDAETAAKAFFSENYGVTDYSYTQWFAVSSTTMAGTVDQIGMRKGLEVYSYEGWWGYDSMPVIYSTNGSEYQTGNWAKEIICNSSNTSVTQYWITKGTNGWRLDVANEVSDETWQRFRDSVKALDSDAVIIGEIWDDATKYLKGDMYDSVMNYLFRNAVTSFAMGTDSETITKEMEKIRERYPEEAFYAMMNLVGSHDTTRILSYLDGIGDDRSDKSVSAAFPTYEGTSETAKQRQYLVAFLQFTYAGAPTIYYGDEIGMVGGDDPDDRRAMAWGQGNQELVEWYAKLAAIRDAYPALRTGSVEPLDLGSGNLLAYIRHDEANTLTVIANNSASAQTAELEGTWVDLISGETFEGTVTVPARNGLILVAEDEVKTITVKYADLAPAYDSAYIVEERSAGEEVHVHSYTAVVTEPTCTEGGHTTYTCSCGDTYVSKEVPALGHSYDAVTTAPTCTEGGYTTYTCSCGDGYVSDYVDALGHSWDEGEVTKEPSAEGYGEVTYTCTVCEDHYTKELAAGVAESVSRTLLSGKSMTLKVVDLSTGKALSAKKVQWSMDAEYAPYASISASGKLTAKKVYEQVTIEVVGKLKNNANAEEIRHTVTIYPLATQVEIWNDNACVNGKTIRVDTSGEVTLPELKAKVYPVDEALQNVTWKSSNTKIVKVDTATGALTWTGKTGTVTITAKTADGTKKTASVKLYLGVPAEKVTIGVKNVNEALDSRELVSGKTLQLTASVTADENKTPTNQKVTWSIASGAEAAKISSTGKVTAKTVYEPVEVKIVATAADGSGVYDEFTVNVQPKNSGILVIRDAEGKNVTKSTVYADLNADGTVELTAWNLGETEATAAQWKPSKDSVATVANGKVTFTKAGTVTITAAAADGRKATVTVKCTKLASNVEITSAKGFTVASGKSITLKAKNVDAASQKVTWSIISGAAYAKISSAGKLTAVKDLTTVQEVVVQATAADGSKKSAAATVTVRPLSKGVQIRSVDETTGAVLLSVDGTEDNGLLGIVRSNTTFVWNMTADPMLKLTAKVYPFDEEDADKNAIQAVNWVSSNKKVATVDTEGNVKCLRAGSTTITASAADGSGAKASFKLTVIKKVKEIKLAETAVVTGGKKLTLTASTVPADPTNKKVVWSVNDTTYASISSKGVLTTKAVTECKDVIVTATAADGSGVSASCKVTICPVTTSVQILNKRGAVVTSTLKLKVGETLKLRGSSLPVGAAGTYTWKSSSTKNATVKDGVVTGVKAGTVTITCTAADGSGVKATVQIKIVN